MALWKLSSWENHTMILNLIMISWNPDYENKNLVFKKQDWNDFNLWPRDIPFQDFSFKTSLSRLLFHNFPLMIFSSRLPVQDNLIMTSLSSLCFHDFYYSKTLLWRLFFKTFHFKTSFPWLPFQYFQITTFPGNPQQEQLQQSPF